ncbi:ankyrin repeat-containing domain protein [Xylaria flabelliformis]|nr:ankyrin repeat-containing domain protein [Xylaria flabelliformis]
MSTIPTPSVEALQRHQDFPPFEQHRSKIRELYLEQNKSREQVKEEMERHYGFPETDLKVYEYGLRHLGFIKKLPIEGWIEVDVCAKKRKEREGKETDVYLSDIKHSWDNIKRRISRHKKEEQVRKRICRRPTPDWPQGIVLKTPPPSPSTMVTASKDNVTQIMTYLLALSPIDIISRASLQLQQLEKIWVRMRSNPSSMVHWLPDVPSSQLVDIFRKIAHIGPSVFQDEEPYKFDEFNFLSDSTNVHCIIPTFHLPWGPCNTSTQATSVTQNQLHFMEALSKLCIILASGDHLEIPDASEMLDWIGMDTHKQVLEIFFTLDLPVVAAMWSRLIHLTRASKSGDVFQTLVEIGYKTHNEWIEQHSKLLFETMAELGSKKVGNIARSLPLQMLFWHDFDFDQDRLLWAVVERTDIDLLSIFVDAKITFTYGTCSDFQAQTFRNSFYKTPASQRHQLIKLVSNAGFDFDHLPCSCWAIHNVYIGVDEKYFGRFRTHRWNPPCSFLDYLWLSGNYEFYEAAIAYSNKTSIQITVSGLIIAASSGLAQLQHHLNSKTTEKNISQELLLETALSLAAGLGNTAAVRSFGEAKVDPNADVLLSLSSIRGFESDWHPLMRAAGGEHLGVVRLLVDMGAELRFDNVSFNPLSAAVWNSKRQPLSDTEHFEQRETVEYFLGEDFPRAYVVDAMFMAVTRRLDSDCFEPDEKIIDMLLNAGIGLSGLNVRGKDLLHYAIDQGCTLKTVKFLLSRGAQIHSRPCDRKKTMLHSAAASPSIDNQQTVQLLLRNGASCTKEWGGPTILESVLPLPEDYPNNIEETRRLQLFCFFLEKGAKVNGPEILARLLYYSAPYELIYQTVQAGPNINPSLVNTDIKYTPLQLAIRLGRLDVARWLISLDADINSPAKPNNGLTALQAACSPGRGHEIHIDFIQFLLDSGAHINAPAAHESGATALQTACSPDGRREIHMGLIQFLIDNGADINAPTAFISGVTALQGAIVTGSVSAFCLLLDAGANVHGTNYCSSALDIAAKYGRLDMVHTLLRKGAESYIQGETPYDGAIELAYEHGFFPIAKLLEKKFAEQD